MGDNKWLGNEFEKITLRALDRMGAWAHFIQPNKGGQQPFDIVAIVQSVSHAIDCKTCVAKSFNINRLEDNQKYAFEKFLEAGGGSADIIVWHDGYAYVIPYLFLKNHGIVKLLIEVKYPTPVFEKFLNEAIREILEEEEQKNGRKSILR